MATQTYAPIMDCNMQNKKLPLFFVPLALLYSLFLAQPINLITSDLGRHLKNGELIVGGKLDVPYKNLYSYTNPDFPFVNHHWGTGVIFYLIERVSGFMGLSIFAITLSVLTYFLFFLLAKKMAGAKIALFCSTFALPLLFIRAEVRPEIFTYLFCGIFLFVLYSYRERLVAPRTLIILPIVQLLWVNLHIYFFLGIVITVIFLIDQSVNMYIKKHFKLVSPLFFTLIGTAFSTLVNPSFIKGALMPLTIFTNYGYRLAENASAVSSPISLSIIFFFVSVFVLVASFMIAKKLGNLSLFNVLISSLAFIAAFSAVRNITLFGYFLIPILAFNLKSIERETGSKLRSHVALILLILVTVLCLIKLNNQTIGLGLDKNDSVAANFLSSNNIHGPIFNDYDVGGYLIYYLYPHERVFVDNRPEAYPASFFNQTYIPMQEGAQWEIQSRRYNFNAIFFNRNDASIWGRAFLFNRSHDAHWATVFADENTIIMVRNNSTNKIIIDKYAKLYE